VGFTFLTEAVGISPVIAAGLASGYWVAMFVGRIVLGSLAERIRSWHVMGTAVGGMLVAAALAIAATPSTATTAVLLFGLSTAPMYPLLVLTTAERTSAAVADRVIGFQAAASALGAAVIPLLIGLATGVSVAAFGLTIAPLCWSRCDSSSANPPWRAEGHDHGQDGADSDYGGLRYPKPGGVSQRLRRVMIPYSVITWMTPKAVVPHSTAARRRMWRPRASGCHAKIQSKATAANNSMVTTSTIRGGSYSACRAEACRASPTATAPARAAGTPFEHHSAAESDPVDSRWRVMRVTRQSRARQPDLATPRKLRRRSSRATMITHSQNSP
jgi:MFS family permease